MEVDVPVLAKTGVTDLHIDCIPAEISGEQWYLQSSPEYFMKRLLAAGSGSIYYLGKAFRDGESGSRHQPEFTMLEWYREGWDEHQLMDELALLIESLGKDNGFSSVSDQPWAVQKWAVQKIRYEDIVEQVVGLNPHTCVLADVQRVASAIAGTDFSDAGRSTCLDLIFSLAVEPALPAGLVFIYDYPACQAALAQLGVDDQNHTVARRFEAFLNGMELANGYFELLDAVELQSRFRADQALRASEGKRSMTIDAKLLDAMSAGLPHCSGVALGVDRLLMQMLEATQIAEVMPFGQRHLL